MFMRSFHLFICLMVQNVDVEQGFTHEEGTPVGKNVILSCDVYNITQAYL